MFSSVFSMFIISGFGTFAPKLFQVFGLFQTYMSRKKIDNLFQIWNRFRESESGQKIGILIFAQFASLLLGGYIISRLQPRARFISIWNCFATLSFLTGILSISFLDCKRSQWINKGYLLFHQYYFLQQKIDRKTFFQRFLSSWLCPNLWLRCWTLQSHLCPWAWLKYSLPLSCWMLGIWQSKNWFWPKDYWSFALQMFDGQSSTLVDNIPAKSVQLIVCFFQVMKVDLLSVHLSAIAQRGRGDVVNILWLTRLMNNTTFYRN